MKFTCNICGEPCARPEGPFTREAATCPHCNSNVRVRAVAALLTRELVGLDLTLPEMPVMKGIRGIGMSDGPRRGLALIDELGAVGELDRYHLFHAARADMLRRLGSFEAAAEAYRRALALMANGVERAYLERRLAAL